MAKRGGFFVRLCYGYVGKYKDTSKMTAKEVIEEFLKSKGVSTPGEFFQKRFSGIRQSGAISGALDSNSDEAEEHAKTYYASLRNTDSDIGAIAKNTGYSPQIIEKIKRYLFIDKHLLSTGYDTFYPDYDISQSWQRLREGKRIQEKDIIMLKHEIEEMSYREMGYTQQQAHDLANEKYNYQAIIKEERKNGNSKKRKENR